MTTASNSWSITRALNVGANTGLSRIDGEALTSSGAINVGANSTLLVNAPLTLYPGSTTAISGSLRLVTDSGRVRAGAEFLGLGDFDIAESGSLQADDRANINVRVENDGRFHVGGLGVGAGPRRLDGCFY